MSKAETKIKFRTTKDERGYYQSTCETITGALEEKDPEIYRVEYGKQDDRGANYICVYKGKGANRWGSSFMKTGEFKAYLEGLKDMFYETKR